MADQPVDGQATLPLAEVWLSISQIADIKKVSKAAISKRVLKLEGEGLITTRRAGAEKKVNLVQFDRAIGEHTDPAQEFRNPGGIATPTTTSPAAPPAPIDDPSKPQYSASRALRESYEAENSRLNLEERTGRLADKAEVERRTFRIFRRVRDRFLSLSAVAAPRVFNASDERTARQIMDEEVRKLLDALAADLDHSGDEADLPDADEVSDAAAGDRSAPEG
jgi:hypothetical protein